jgi:branched-chain amino acid transport system substrate-binding protein
VVGQLETTFDETTTRLRQDDPDAVAYFGFGLTAVRLAEAFDAAGWDPLRVMTAGFLTAPLLPGGWQVLRGWHGIDLYDQANVVGQDFLDRFEKRFGYRPENYFAVNAYDTGQLLAQGIGRARPLSTEGVRSGLEAVKMLPGASGGPGTMLGYAPYAHRGWLAQDYLVISRVQAGFADEGLMSRASTEVVHHMTPRSRSVRNAGRRPS